MSTKNHNILCFVDDSRAEWQNACVWLWKTSNPLYNQAPSMASARWMVAYNLGYLITTTLCCPRSSISDLANHEPHARSASAWIACPERSRRGKSLQIISLSRRTMILRILPSNHRPGRVPPVRGPHGQVFVRGVEIPRLWGPGKTTHLPARSGL